jgi:dihydrofolate reductase
MRKIAPVLLMSLDGVVESPNEWGFSRYFNDEMSEGISAGIAQADAVLLGRRTYLEFAELWPNQGSDVLMADFLNNSPKYVVSTTLDMLRVEQLSVAHRRPRRGARQAQAAARQEHPDPRQPHACADAAARRAAR